jgi:hypothetical protein
MQARCVKQISVFLENRPGVLSAIARKIAQAGVNLKAISIGEAIDHAVVRMVMSDTDKARQVLAKNDVVFLENEVIEVSIEDRPGSLADFTSKLAEAGINLEYAYGSSPADSKLGLIIIRVDKPDLALNIASKM